MHSAFVALFFDLSHTLWVSSLYACDLDTGSWTLIAVGLPWMPHPHDKMKLMVSSERLFMMQFRGLASTSLSHLTQWEVLLKQDSPLMRTTSVTIYEFFMAEKEVVKVAEMPRYANCDLVVVVALGEPIVVSSLVAGECVAFDLRRRCWHDPARDTLEHAFGTCVPDSQHEFVGVMQLDLWKMKL